MPKLRVCVVGAGLAGTMCASLLDTLDIFEIDLYEKRPDPATEVEEDGTAQDAFGRSTSATKRSINLALSFRGQCALRELGLYDEAMQDTVPMPGRVIHTDKDGGTTYQAYGKPGQAIHSVSRQGLNNLLLKQARQSKNVRVHFSCAVKKLDTKAGKVDFTDGTSKEFDLIIGADGAYSMTRDLMLRENRTSFSRDYIAHGYKELCIPAVGGDYALENPHGLHIWPRGHHMLIALPNADKSFTATLFAPYRGANGFDAVDADNADEIKTYFAANFPEMLTLMPNLVDDYKTNPVGSLVTIRVNPWHVGTHTKTVLIGDAAHAVVPFFGQGMNAAFEDGLQLFEHIRDATISLGANSTFTKDKLSKVVEAFATARKPAADGLADLCVEHYHDMASNTASTLYLIQKKLEAVLHDLVPSHFTPLYTMVAFTRTPYHEAISRAERQDFYTSMAVWAAVGATAVLGGMGLWNSRVAGRW